jgi:predicted metal-dependent hydrolase
MKLNICSSPTDTKLELKDNQFYVYLKNDKEYNIDSRLQIRSMYENWIKQQATKILEPKVLKYGKVIMVKPKKTIFKNRKNRWGSATKDGTLNLNFNILKAPEDVIDYVITHELCHLKIKEHSHHYWNLVKKYTSDYKRKIEWLEINGKHLLI